MSSWEDIANEVVPAGAAVRGLATGARRNSVAAVRMQAPVAPQVVSCPECGPEATLEMVLRGCHRETVDGAFFHVARMARELEASFCDLAELLGYSVQLLAESLRTDCCANDLLFLDIETTGLSSTRPLFLIGALHCGAGQGAALELFLARNIREERAAVACFLKLAEGKTLVTFNGKSFDWPYIEGRAVRFGLRLPRLRGHFDLLHHARRQWKPLVPNCRLQTLELYLCGRTRAGDIPSSRIPRQYLEFSRLYESSGRGAHLVAPIVHHNIWDVLTMADLLRRCEQQSPGSLPSR